MREEIGFYLELVKVSFRGCDHMHEMPLTAGDQRGNLLLKDANGRPVCYVGQTECPTLAEIDEFVRDLGGYRGVSEGTVAQRFQGVLQYVLDKVNDGGLRLRQVFRCPDCGAESSHVERLVPPVFKTVVLPPADWQKWDALDASERRDLVAKALAAVMDGFEA